MKRVLAGIRATGRLHLGNYLGAVRGMLELQDDPAYETLYMVADLHTITTPYDPKELTVNKREVVVDYLAAGLDPEKSILFIQSDVKEHAELAFYFSSVMTVARMQHLPTYKEKVKQYPQNVTMALLNYPVLMAADILLYKAHAVPVGIDQEPHIEVAREVARKMNERYGTDFPEPQSFRTAGEYTPSLKGEGKMSKSIEGSYVTLTDTADEVRKKIRSIPTATEAGGEETPGIKALFTFAKLFVPDKLTEFEASFKNGSLQFVEVKDAVAEGIYKTLQPIQEKRRALAENKKYVETVVAEGATRAREIAIQTIEEVKSKMGLS